MRVDGGEALEPTEEEKRALKAQLRRMRRQDDDDDDNNVATEDGTDGQENGSERVLEPEEETLWIRFERLPDPVPVLRYRWKQCLRDNERHLPEDQWTEYVQISQFPLMLAYASTIHKTQSLTISAAVLSLGDEAAKNPGQAYTALSRVESIDGLHLTKLSHNAFRSDQFTKEFYQRLQRAQDQTQTS